jgi:TRAP-type C4-dicarboxylate transport system permease small subunit
MIYQIFDILLIVYIFLIFFLRYLVNAQLFLPEEIYSALFGSIEILGFSEAPRIFWILSTLLFGSIIMRIVEKIAKKIYRLKFKDEISGKEYLRRHDLD